MDALIRHRSGAELEARLDHVRAAPTSRGTVEMIVARPAVDERVVLDAAQLTVEDGLVGDGWRARGSRRTPDGGAEQDAQIAVTSAATCTEPGTLRVGDTIERIDAPRIGHA